MTGTPHLTVPKKWLKFVQGDRLRLNLMMLPGVTFVFLFNTMTLLGIVVAFQDFIPRRGWFGSEWVGWRNFELFFSTPNAYAILRNTLVIAVGKIVLTLIAAVSFALLLSELHNSKIKRIVQTAVYLPHFVSWVIYATIIRLLLNSDGLVNRLLMGMGLATSPIKFLSTKQLFPLVMVLIDVIKEFGYSSVIYLATITGINPSYYEAAAIDGASRPKMMWYITLPCLLPTILLLTTLASGNVLNAGFDQIFNLYNPAVYETGDIIDTYVHRVGLVNLDYGLGAAVSLFKSVVSFMLIVSSYTIAAKVADYRIF
jgi:putative aldouronate transport system permease protein